MPIRAVVFDLFITLTDFDAERRRPAYEAELATMAGVDPAVFSSLMRETFTARVTGALGDSRSTLATLMERMGHAVGDEQLDALVTLRRQQQRRVLCPRAGVVEALGRIRDRGYPIGILTDCTSEVVDLWPAQPYAAVTDAVTFSCQVGHRKPHPAGYHDVTQKLGVRLEECLYVGDGSSGELTGAAALGMTPVLVETPFGTDFRYDAEAEWSGRRVTEVSEIESLLRELGGQDSALA